MCGEGVEEQGRPSYGAEGWGLGCNPSRFYRFGHHLWPTGWPSPHFTLGQSRQRPMGTQERGTCPWKRVGQVWGHLHAPPLTPHRGGGPQSSKPEQESCRSTCGTGSPEGEARVLI